MNGARALTTRQLLRRMQARGHRISAAKLEEMLRESEAAGVVERTSGGWTVTPEWSSVFRRLPELPGAVREREQVAA